MRRFSALFGVMVLACAGAPGAALAIATTPAATTSTPGNSAPVIPPSGSGAGSSPFTPGVPQQTPTVTTTATPTIVNTSGSSGSAGLSGSTALLVAIGAMILLVGIGWYIWRDARKNAPIRAHHAHDDIGGRRTGSKKPPAGKSRKLSAAEKKRRKRGKAR